MVLARLFGRSELKNSAEKLYMEVVTQARKPVFYDRLGVPDTVDGRFDMIALHAFLVMRRLKGAGAGAAALSQALFDALFTDMDRNLREMGAGDLGVGRRVKTMAKAFYGRLAAYDDGLDGDDDALLAALRRNLFRGCQPGDGAAALDCIAGYVRREAAALDERNIEDLLAGRPSFGPPPEISG